MSDPNQIASVFIVFADNHDYDFMSEWQSEFAYTEEGEANKELERMQKEYWKKNKGSKKRGFPNIEVREFPIAVRAIIERDRDGK